MKDERDDRIENAAEDTADPCPDSLKPYRWQKGRSGNPGGRPRKAPISDAYARHIEDPLPDDLRSKLRLPKGATWADAMALGQMRSAVKGNTVAAKEIADRVEGRLPLPMKVEPSEEDNQVRVIVTHIVPPRDYGRKELTNGSHERQTDSQNSSAIESEPGRAERKPWERPRKENA